jgi:hypothetical protein
LVSRENLTWLIPLLSLFVILVLLMLFMGRINEDEGFYVGAGKLVSEGNAPFIDFFYTQGPLLPYLYGLFFLVLPPVLYTGRALAAIAGIAVLLITAAASRRLAGAVAGFAALALLVFNSNIAYHFVIAKTYPFAALFLVLALYLLAVRPMTVSRGVLAVFFSCCAAATRVSLIAVALVIVLYLFVLFRGKAGPRAAVLGAFLLSVTVFFVPFLLAAREPFLFGLWGFHRYSEAYNAGPLQVAQKLATLALVFQRYPLLVILVLGAAFYWVYRLVTGPGETWKTESYPLLLIASLAAGFVANFIVPALVYFDYLTPLMPVAALLSGLFLSRCFEGLQNRTARILLIVFFLALNVFQLFQQDILTGYYLQGGRTLPVEEVREVSDFINKTVDRRERIFTLYETVALEGGRETFPGLEMAIFSYQKGMPTDRCRRLRVVNDEILEGYLTAEPSPVVVLPEKPRYFYPSYEELKKKGALAGYYVAKKVAPFGQERETVTVLLPRKLEPARLRLGPGERLKASDTLEILQASPDRKRVRRHAFFNLRLVWQVTAEPEGPVHYRVLFLRRGGRTGFYADHTLAYGSYPVGEMKPGRLIVEEQTVVLQPEMPAGPYQLGLSVENNKPVFFGEVELD